MGIAPAEVAESLGNGEVHSTVVLTTRREVFSCHIVELCRTCCLFLNSECASSIDGDVVKRHIGDARTDKVNGLIRAVINLIIYNVDLARHGRV